MVSAGEVGKQTELKLYYTSLLSKRHNQSWRECIGKPNPPPMGTFYNTNLYVF